MALLALTLALGLAGSAGAAGKDQPDPIKIVTPGGQGIVINTDPLGITGLTGLSGTPLNKIPDFSLNLLLIQCGSSMTSDGSVWCGVGGKPKTTPTPSPTPTPDKGAGNGSGTGNGNGPGDANGPGGDGSGDGTGDGSHPSSHPGTTSPGDAGPGGSADADARRSDATPPSAEAGGKVPAAHPHRTSAHTAHQTAAGRGTALNRRTGLSDHELLVLAASAATLIGLVGRGGVARSSARTWRKRYPKAAAGSEGEVVTPDSEMYEFDPDAGGPGDRSRTWGLVAGWAILDRLSRLTPFQLAKRVPLVARILADAPYLRAIFGAGSLLLILAAFVLGLASAHNTDGYPLAPALGLCVALVVIASLDATAGLIGVVGYTIGLFVWGPGDLGFGASLRSFLGMAALWFAIPLIASSARPLRRTIAKGGMYTWDRCADGVIAALIAGWAVQDAVNGLAGLSGHQSPIATHADALALWAIGGIVLRVALEEVAARLFPERLKVVDTGLLPEPSTARNLYSAALRVAIFVFVCHAFLGNCWQLWASAALFALPEALDLVADRLPNRPRLYAVLPRGVALVLALLIIELLVAAYANDAFAHNDLMRNAFVLIMVPEFVFAMVGLFGREGPETSRKWLYEALGAATVVITVVLALNG